MLVHIKLNTNALNNLWGKKKMKSSVFRCMVLGVFLTAFLMLIPTGLASTGWTRTYPGESMDILSPVSVIQTSDGGYVTLVNGFLRRIDNVGFPGHFSEFYELQVIKISSIGEIQWKQNFSDISDPHNITPLFNIYSNTYGFVQTADQGYVIAGSGDFMFWMFKIDSQGAILWSKNYVYSEEMNSGCAFYSIIRTSDNGFALAGSIQTSEGGLDFWLIKTDSDGKAQWNQTYNSGTYTNSNGDVYPCADEAKNVIQTRDGGYALVGSNSLFRASTSSIVYATWLVKTDSQGKPLWNKGYDCPNESGRQYSIIQTSDDGYAITGTQNGDFYILKIDSTSKHQWNKTYGSTQIDTPCKIIQLNDDGLTVAGTWTKINATSVASTLGLLRLNSSGEMNWLKTYTAKENSTTISVDSASDMILTSDGSYVIVGSTLYGNEYHQDVFFVKTEPLEEPLQPTSTPLVTISPSLTPTPEITSTASPTVMPTQTTPSMPTATPSNSNLTPSPSIPEFSFLQILLALVIITIMIIMGISKDKLKSKKFYR